jgi:hypothetical protein
MKLHIFSSGLSDGNRQGQDSLTGSIEAVAQGQADVAASLFLLH